MFKTEQRVRPVLKWAGGKSQLLPQLIHRFPTQFNRYIEPFLGSGACFFSLHQHLPAVLNDVNPEIINLYRVIRSHPQDLVREIDKLRMSYSEAFYYELRTYRPKCKIQQAARTVFLNKTGYNGLYRQNAKGEFNVPFGHRRTCPKLYDPENILNASKKLRNAKLYSKDFEEVIEIAKKGDFVYCDPPYEPISKTSSFNSYRKGGFSQQEQERLLRSAERARIRGATVIISNSFTKFILDLYDAHTLHKVKARRAINSKGDRRQEIFEVLIEVLG